MKRSLSLLVLVGLLVILTASLFSACSHADYNVAVGEEFIITTKPNASTGYTLYVKEFDKSFLTLVEDKAVPDRFHERNLKFKALKKGYTEITMESKPYWWDSIPPDKQKEYNLSTTAFSVKID
jgi:hypothetical protein